MLTFAKRWLLPALIITLLAGCSGKSGKKSAIISGNFSVADSIDATGDFSGIGITVVSRDSSNADADTLFHTITDSAGRFSGKVEFKRKRQYPLIVSRNQKNLAQFGVILADEDSVSITGQLPNLSQTLSISSREHDAMQDYQRLNKNFQRVMTYVRSGQLEGDTLQQELQKWSNIYWDVFENNQGTIASELSARKSINILQGWNNKEMMSRIRSVQDIDALSDLGATYGKQYLANSRGLQPTLAYLDSLKSMTEKENKVMQISMEQIKLLYDSARIESAKEQLTQFKEKYTGNKRSKQWVESISYDLNYLSPGDSLPDFSFRENGKTISRDSLKGTPYILEITNLSDRLYQNQFDRTVVIHSIYKNYGLQVITIPLDPSQVTVDGFFEERVKPWPVADADDFDRKKIVERFNIQFVPTRFLVDRNGKIVRKYVGSEYQDIIQGIQSIIKQEQPNEPAS